MINSNLSFSSNLKFCYSQEFQDKMKTGLNVSITPKSGKKIGTEGVLNCVAGGITGGNTDKNLVFHISPKRFFENDKLSLEKFKKIATETISRLKEEGKKPQGFFFGGDDSLNQSKELMIALSRVFDELQLPYTVFWGTKDSINHYHRKSIFYDGESDSWLLNVYPKQTQSSLVNKANVTANFSYIRISQNDRVKFLDTGWINGEEKILDKGTLYN